MLVFSLFFTTGSCCWNLEIRLTRLVVSAFPAYIVLGRSFLSLLWNLRATGLCCGAGTVVPVGVERDGLAAMVDSEDVFSGIFCNELALWIEKEVGTSSTDCGRG